MHINICILVLFLTHFFVCDCNYVPRHNDFNDIQRRVRVNYFKHAKPQIESIQPVAIVTKHGMKRFENYLRKGSLTLTDKVKLALSNAMRAPDKLALPSADDSININDFFDENGMLFLTPPGRHELRLLNKAMNKAIALKYAGPDATDIRLSSEEQAVLRKVVEAMKTGLRAADTLQSDVLYNFNELVA